jgi:GTP-binding protein
MVMLMVLIDSRHDMQDVDLRFISELGEKGIPFGIIFTKADKQGPEALERQILKNKGRLLEDWEELPPCFVSSSVKGIGKDEIINYIGSILQTL